MTAAGLLRDLELRGARFRVDGDQVRVSAPPGVLTPDIVTTLREHKPALLRILRDGTPTAWPSNVPLPVVKAGCACPLCSPEGHGYPTQLEAAKAIFPEAFVNPEKWRQ